MFGMGLRDLLLIRVSFLVVHILRAIEIDLKLINIRDSLLGVSLFKTTNDQGLLKTV